MESESDLNSSNLPMAVDMDNLDLTTTDNNNTISVSSDSYPSDYYDYESANIKQEVDMEVEVATEITDMPPIIAYEFVGALAVDDDDVVPDNSTSADIDKAGFALEWGFYVAQEEKVTDNNTDQVVVIGMEANEDAMEMETQHNGFFLSPTSTRDPIKKRKLQRSKSADQLNPKKKRRKKRRIRWALTEEDLRVSSDEYDKDYEGTDKVARTGSVPVSLRLNSGPNPTLPKPVTSTSGSISTAVIGNDNQNNSMEGIGGDSTTDNGLPMARTCEKKARKKRRKKKFKYCLKPKLYKWPKPDIVNRKQVQHDSTDKDTDPVPVPSDKDRGTVSHMKSSSKNMHNIYVNLLAKKDCRVRLLDIRYILGDVEPGSTIKAADYISKVTMFGEGSRSRGRSRSRSKSGNNNSKSSIQIIKPSVKAIRTRDFKINLTDIGQREHKCEVCDKLIPLKLLSSHKSAHTVECHICGSGIPIPEVVAHGASHVSSLVCEVCSYRASTRSGLWCHMNRHFGVRPIICMRCGHSFASANGFRLHYTTKHTKAAEMACEFCDMKFTSLRAKSAHVYRHTGSSCVYCNREWSSRKELDQHVLAEHYRRLDNGSLVLK